MSIGSGKAAQNKGAGRRKVPSFSIYVGGRFMHRRTTELTRGSMIPEEEDCGTAGTSPPVRGDRLISLHGNGEGQRQLSSH